VTRQSSLFDYERETAGSVAQIQQEIERVQERARAVIDSAEVSDSD